MTTPRPLCDFPGGSLLTISQLEDCPHARCRLCAMGLTPGTDIELTSSGHGPCRVKVRGSQVVLGHGLAKKILAVPSSNGNGDKAASLRHMWNGICRTCETALHAAKPDTPAETP